MKISLNSYGERLSTAFYIAISFAFVGLVVTAWSTLCRIAKSAHIKSNRAKCIDMALSLFAAILCISLSMVIQAKAVEALIFSQIIIIYATTLFVICCVAVFFFVDYRKKLWAILKRYYPLFLFAEIFELAARLASLRAIETGPSVTAVALVHSTLPILIIFLSLLLIGADRIQNFLTPVLRETFVLQSQSIQTKITLLVVSVAAALILQQNSLL